MELRTWSGCCDNDSDSNLSRHSPSLKRAYHMWLLILLNIVDVAFMKLIVWCWKGTTKPYFLLKCVRVGYFTFGFTIHKYGLTFRNVLYENRTTSNTCRHTSFDMLEHICTQFLNYFLLLKFNMSTSYS